MVKLSHAPRVVALTGAFGFLGRRLIRLLIEDERVETIVAIDVRDPRELLRREGHPEDPQVVLREFPKVSAHQLDLAERGADRRLAEILSSEGADALCHLAFLSNPTHREELAHEVETIGTMHALYAAQAAPVKRLVMSSSTIAYGAHPDNPAWLTEEHPLRGMEGSRYVQDKVDAEQQLERFALENPGVSCIALRMSAMLGGSRTRNFWTRYLTRKVVPTVMGYDPLFQFLYPDDAVRALYFALRSDATGAYNVAGQGVLPLSRVIERLARTNLPVPATWFSATLASLWNLQLMEMPAVFMQYLRWSWVCDGKKFRDAVGFEVQYDIDTLLDLVAREFDR